MKLLLYVLLLHMLYYLYLLLRFIAHRVNLLVKLKRFSSLYKIEFNIVIHRLLLPSNRWGSAVVLKAGSTVFQIRLFGLLRKNCAVHFWNENAYSVEKFIPRMSLTDTPLLGHTNARRRRMGRWDVPDSAQEETVNVLLYSPANSLIRVTQTKVNHLERLLAGERIGDVLFADTDYLFRYIAYRHLEKE